MKLLAVVVLFLSSFVNAQCLKTATPLGGEGWPDGIPASGVGYIRVCPPEAYYSPNAACTAGQYWVPYSYSANPVFTADTLETCTGYWIPTAAEVKQQQSLGVTPEGFLQSFTFGLTLYLTFWYGPYLVSLARQLINKL